MQIPARLHSFQEVERVICPRCQALSGPGFTFCGNCGNSLTEKASQVKETPRTPEIQPTQKAPEPWQVLFPPSVIQASFDAAAPEMPDLFLSPGIPSTPGGQYDTPDSFYVTGVAGDHAGQYIPRSSASQYPRTPGEQYMPDNRAGQYIPAAHAPAGVFRPDVRRLSRVEQTAGGATLIVLISLFLPWFGFDELATNISISGTTAHGYLLIVVLLAVLMAGCLLWRSGREEFPVRAPITHETMLLAATGLQFLLVAIAFLDVPASGLGREIGAYLALIASVAAVGPAVMPAVRSWQASG